MSKFTEEEIFPLKMIYFGYETANGKSIYLANEQNLQEISQILMPELPDLKLSIINEKNVFRNAW